MIKNDNRKDRINYEDFNIVFCQEGVTQQEIIDYLWTLRLGYHAFSDSFQTKEELQQTIRNFREFLLQVLYGNSSV